MTYHYGTTVRVMQRNFVLTEEGEMVPYGEWYENKHLRYEEVHKVDNEKEESI